MKFPLSSASTIQFRRFVIEDVAGMVQFPAGFQWGVSTSAHQFEGGNVHNQWHEWECRGRIRSGDKSGNACNWWLRAEEDLDRAQQLGLNALRISLEWSRLEPKAGRWDKHALHRYREILKAIRSRGMRVFISLHHFTHPTWFEYRGAFTSNEGPHFFDLFAERAVTEFGDLCTDWVTFNEPNVYASFGYLFGEFPPGRVNDLQFGMAALLGAHRAHALAYDTIHRLQSDAGVGMAINYVVFRAATHSLADRMLTRIYDAAFNRSTLSLLQTGSMPGTMSVLAGRVPEVVGKIDFIGLNIYNRLHVRWPTGDNKTGGIFVPPNVPQGDHGCELPYGEAFPDGVIPAVEAYSQLKKPIFILENGVPDRSDRIRPWVIVKTLQNIGDLIDRGFDIRGYFHWSLVDNFEWNEGWKLRFGLYEIDPRTQKRSPRMSARLYRDIVTQNSISDYALEHFGREPIAKVG
jgi:beta-glucosidase